MNSNNEKLQEVENRLKYEKNRRMFERYQTIRLYLMGNTYKQISTILGRSEKTVSNYILAYKKHGIEGVTMKFSSGKPPRLTEEQQEQLKQAIITHVPHEVGFTAKLIIFCLKMKV